MKKYFPVFVLLILSCGIVAQARAALQIQSWMLNNGTRVLFVESHAIPILDINVQFDAGTRRDPEGKSGLAALTNILLTRGVLAGEKAPAMTEAQILDGFADIAAQRDAGASPDRAGVTLRTLADVNERAVAVDLLARVLARPSFPAGLFERDKARSIANVRESRTRPEDIVIKEFLSAIYGRHPYGGQETEETLTAITREDVIHFHREHYVANRAVVAMIGDVTRAEADTIARQLTQELPQGGALPTLPEVATATAQERRIPYSASQSHILIGLPVLARGDPDYFALTLGNYILGSGGFVSRLTQEVREKRALSYSVYSDFTSMAQKGPFEIGFQTKQDQTDEALNVVRQTLATYLKTGPTIAELKAARSNLTGGFALRIDNNRKILDNLAVIGFYDLPLDYLNTWITNINKVTLSQIRDVFRRRIVPEQLTTVVVGEVN